MLLDPDASARLRAAPGWVLLFSRRAGIPPDKLRWCDWCHVIAYAIDDHQRDQLDAVGFTGRICPDCAYPDP